MVFRHTSEGGSEQVQTLLFPFFGYFYSTWLVCWDKGLDLDLNYGLTIILTNQRTLLPVAIDGAKQICRYKSRPRNTILTNIQRWLRNMVRVTGDPIVDLALSRHAGHVKVPLEDTSSVLRPSPHCRINML